MFLNGYLFLQGLYRMDSLKKKKVRFSEEMDLLLLREVLGQNPFEDYSLDSDSTSLTGCSQFRNISEDPKRSADSFVECMVHKE